MKYFLVLILINVALINSAPLNDLKNLMEGELFEGDMAGVRIIQSNSTKGYAQLETNQYGLWTGGIVPYVFDSVYTTTEKNTILQGMKLIESKTCIRFVPRTNQLTYLRIYSGSGCWSYVGRQKKNGEQLVSLERPGCVYNGIAAHELLHALGFWHEQSRVDRDNYVTINYNNIVSGQEHNFNKYDTNTATTLGFGYDYYSIMHYEWNAFSKNGQATITPKQAGVQLLAAWQKTSLSPTDIAEVKKYYSCA